MRLIQVVRRYGPVGGMERYVWEMTHELRNLGHEVLVLCEVCLADKPHGIVVHELGTATPRPRWLALLRFGRRVARWLEENPHPGWLIHSHERLNSHHITTFHGPPFATVRDMPWWRKLSLRVAMQFYLERRELKTAQVIVPNSPYIRRSLAHYYPEFSHKLAEPVVPGVAPMQIREMRCIPAKGGIIGFVGKEWQRKGLPLAVEIVALLRRTRPDLQIWVAGPDSMEIQHLFAGWQGGYRLLGWSNQTHYAKFDVLLHPARAEPYGMVISEAMAARVPVVISDVCGAAAQVTNGQVKYAAPDDEACHTRSPHPIPPPEGEGSNERLREFHVYEAGTVLPLAAPVEKWAVAVEEQLQRSSAPPQFVRGWDKVAQEYETIYRDYLARQP